MPFNFFAHTQKVYIAFFDDLKVPGYEQGNFVGPTILADVTADMECYKV